MKNIYLLILLTIATIDFAVSQNQNKETILKEWERFSNSEADQILKEGLNLKPYLYKGTNLNRQSINNFEDYPQKIIFYWTSECRYCKKELDDLEKIISEQPYLKDSILVVMRVDKQNKEWSIQKDNDFYTLYKEKKDFMTLSIPILFVSEKILDESSLKSAPNTLFLDDNQKIVSMKSGYIVTTRKSKFDEMNYEFLKWKINKHLDSRDSG